MSVHDPASLGVNGLPGGHSDDASRLGAGICLNVLWQHRRMLATIVMVGCLLTLIATFLVKKTYRASSSFVAASALTDDGQAAVPGALMGVAGRLGLRLGAGEDLGELFPQLLRSRTLLEKVLARPLPLSGGGVDSLARWLDPSGRTPSARSESALRKLRGKLLAGVDGRTGLVTVSVTLADPVLAAAAANACVEELDAFAVAARREHSSRQSDFIRTRLQEVGAELAAAESALQDFRERNRRVVDSPQLLLQQERLARVVEVAQRVFLELTAQREIARIEQARDVPLLIVLDKAVPPVRKHAPQRLRLLCSAAVLSLLVGFAVVVAKHAREPRLAPTGIPLEH